MFRDTVPFAKRSFLLRGLLDVLVRLDRTRTYVVFTAIFIGLIAGTWVRPGMVIANADTFYPYHPFDLLAKSIFAWNHLYSPFGQYDNDVVLSGWLVILGVMEPIFGPSGAQIVLMASFLFGGWLAFFVLGRRLGLSPIAAAGAGWLYAFNPLTQAEFGTSILINMAFFAMAPALLALLHLACGTPSARPLVRFILCCTAATLITLVALNPPVLLLLLVLPILFLPLIVQDAADRPAFFRWLATTYAMCLVCALWWLVPAGTGFLTNRNDQVLDPTQYAFYLRRAGFANQLRFNPWWVFESFGGAAAYEKGLVTYAAGFVPIVLAALALVVAPLRSKRTAAYLLALGLVMIFLSKGLREPFEWLNALFYRLPGAFLYREPTTKFPLISTLAVSIAAAIALNVFFTRWSGARALRIPAWIAIIFVSTSAASLLISGAIFNGWTMLHPSARVALSPDYEAARAWFTAHPASGSTLLLPGHKEYQATYAWGFQGIDIIPTLEIPSELAFVGARPGYVADARALAVGAVIERMIYGGDSRVVDLMRRLGITRVLYRRDVDQADALPMSSSTVRAIFNAPAARFGAIEIYDLGVGSRIDAWNGVALLRSRKPLTIEDGVRLALASDVPRVAAATALASSVMETDDVVPGVNAPVSAPSPAASSAAIAVPFAPARDGKRFPKTNDVLLSSASLGGTTDLLRFIVVNPTNGVVTATVGLDVFVDVSSVFTLTSERLDNSMPNVIAIEGAAGNQRVLFYGERFLPGSTIIDIARVDGAGETVPSLFSPNPFSLGTLSFANVHFSSHAYLAGERIVGTMSLPIADSPVISVGFARNGLAVYNTLLVSVLLGDRRTVCPISMPPDTLSFALTQSLMTCFVENGVPLDDLARARITGLQIVYGDSPQKKAIRSVAYRRQPELLYPFAALTPSAAPAETFACRVSPCTPIRSEPRIESKSDASSVILVSDASTRLVRTLDAFDRFELGFVDGRPVPHVLVDAWRSGWAVPGAGRLVTVHLLDLFEILAGCVALFLLTYVGAKCARS